MIASSWRFLVRRSTIKTAISCLLTKEAICLVFYHLLYPSHIHTDFHKLHSGFRLCRFLVSLRVPEPRLRNIVFDVTSEEKFNIVRRVRQVHLDPNTSISWLSDEMLYGAFLNRVIQISDLSDADNKIINISGFEKKASQALACF